MKVSRIIASNLMGRVNCSAPLSANVVAVVRAIMVRAKMNGRSSSRYRSAEIAAGTLVRDSWDNVD